MELIIQALKFKPYSWSHWGVNHNHKNPNPTLNKSQNQPLKLQNVYLVFNLKDDNHNGQPTATKTTLGHKIILNRTVSENNIIQS